MKHVVTRLYFLSIGHHDGSQNKNATGPRAVRGKDLKLVYYI